jgi:hypothetical protein
MNTAHIRPPGALANLRQMRMHIPSGRHVAVSESKRDAHAHSRILKLGKFGTIVDDPRGRRVCPGWFWASALRTPYLRAVRWERIQRRSLGRTG